MRRGLEILLLGTALLQAPAAPAAAPEWLRAPHATMERVAEPVLGGEIALYRAGVRGAEPVVLVHGLGQNGARDWQWTIPALAQRHDVLAIDLPGFGASDKGNKLYSPDNFARALDAALAPRVPKPFALVGHSMGAAVALAYAHAFPARVSRLVLVDMAGVLHRSVYAEFLSRLGAEQLTGMSPAALPGFDRIVRSLLLRAENLPIDSELLLQVEPMRQKLFRGDPNSIAAYALVHHDFSQALRAVRVPTLLVWGDADKVAPLRTGQVALATVPGARLAVVQGAGHSPQLERPERFNALLLEELQRAPPAVPARSASAPATARVASCEAKAGQRFSGDFKQLTLTRCADAQIVDARVGLLVLTDSSAHLLNTEISQGINARGSAVELTGGRVRGAPALVLDASSVDAAGTRLEGDAAIAVNRGALPVTLHLSVSEVVRGSTVRTAHDLLRLAPGQAW